MKSTGMVRRVDELGRIVIPKEIRNKLEIDVKDPIEIYVEGNSIVLRKYVSGCIFCNSAKDLTNYKDKLICKKCLAQILEITDSKEN